ncbi:hypothetical protein G6045_27725 [Streptomyces sp. YC504]|uniref:Lipoprotein n=1 Tax=Streptomyces mesophilus TaxID=1775132 RepID=A0A6G4XS25_9ACTN|nr:hypothetical protein [Streptomyces mesophilus]NGO79411.1 hypothetical protein [Streptomyces mesophilus]
MLDHTKDVRRAVAAAALLGAALVGCSMGGDDMAGGPPEKPAAAAAATSAEPSAAEPGEPGDPVTPEDPMSPGPEKVRDAFAGLQATLDDTCTPGAGDCAYFLGRVHEELAGLEAAMKNDPKGPGHFPEPLSWIAGLNKTLDGDLSTENLEAHMKDLTGVRDRINTWMQDHPDDYR